MNVEYFPYGKPQTRGPRARVSGIGWGVTFKKAVPRARRFVWPREGERTPFRSVHRRAPVWLQHSRKRRPQLQSRNPRPPIISLPS